MLVGAAVIAAFALGLPKHLSLHELARDRRILDGFVHAHPVESVLAYMAAYLVLVALSLPGALIMTLTGGFLFGAAPGAAAAVTGASAGAVVMYLMARTALGDVLRDKLHRSGGLLHKVECAVRDHGFSSLLTLRLIPAMPFFAVNIAAGLVDMPLRTYVLATVLGIFPSTLIYASVGSDLQGILRSGHVPTLHSLIQPHMIAPLVALALLSAAPLVWRLWRRRAVQH